MPGIRVVKAYVQEENEIGVFRRLSREYMGKNLTLAKFRGALWGGMTFLSGSSLVSAW